MGSNYVSIFKHGCIVGVCELISNIIPHFYDGCDYLSMLGLKLNHASERGPPWHMLQWIGSSLVTHWGQVTHICVSKLTIIGSDNGLSPGRRQAIIWTNDGISLIGHLGTNFSEILIGIHISMVSCQKGPTRHAYAWQIGPFWQDTLDIFIKKCI